MNAHTDNTAAALAAGGIWPWAATQTEWGRDPEMWPGLLELIPQTGTVWCAGAATGEEALTLAARTPDTVKIVASELLLPALKAAWEGRYPRRMVDAAVEARKITADEADRIFADYDEAATGCTSTKRSAPASAGGRTISPRTCR
ncbi:CheR family methyltransferase [Microbacterium esteraromaticum]|nr:CheR family methyltransferase [Microbacterium esteraromaticum]